MKLLVTGAAGFIGSTFVDFALGEAELLGITQVTGIDSFTYAGSLSNLEKASENSRFKLVKGDIRDAQLISNLVNASDVVLNFAAESHVDRSIEDPAIFVDTNVMGTVNILNAINQMGKRLIQISTDEVYGSIESGSWDEEFPLRPNSPYAASKASADLLVRSYSQTYGCSTNITRCCNNYGPRQYPEKIIPLFVSRLVRGETIPVYGDGLNMREWIHVNDHVRGILKVLLFGKPGEIYNLGAGLEISNIDLAEKILGILDLPKSRIEFVKDRPGHDLRYSLDFAKASNELGFQCLEDFETGFGDTVRIFASQFK